MEQLLQHLDRFSEVVAASSTTHVRTWDAATVRRALQWARYLRHVYVRFSGHGRIRTALDQRLRSHWRHHGGLGQGRGPVAGLLSFQALAHADTLLSLLLLRNRNLGDAVYHYLLLRLFPGPGVQDAEKAAFQDELLGLARRGCAVHLLRVLVSRENPDIQADPVMQMQAELLLERVQQVGEAEGPGGFLSSLWERWPHNHFLQVTAVALLYPPKREDPGTLTEGSQELIRWLLGKPDVTTAFCRNLPAGLLTSVASRHPALSRVYLGLLIDCGRRLHYDLQKGLWVETEAQDMPWEDLFDRFQSLSQAPPPLKNEVLTSLESCKAQDGDFQVSGLSIWTDLLLALRPDV
ncbi:Fanconi anemia group F protein [Perognathus longimembris pacificus]|uniref:Fanconi anemia group F protein n=1 Tax=Perognathus longimembris pacificus TaxID=214514 RepID=UPI0020196635|nr:Fanconi anemia group F protein [Perognathus longimembris pacificus]